MCASAEAQVPSLKAAGLRQTPQREAILAVLREADRPLRVEEIWSRMPGVRSGIPTIYRNLEKFIAEGWVEALQGRDQALRYVRCLSRSHHHHMECEACGRVVEVEECTLEPLLARMGQACGFQVTRHHLQLFGVCPACRAGKPVDR